MIIDVKKLLNIKDIAFYHIIHDLREPKNDFLATDGTLCREVVMMNANNKINL